jgi:hypothetical protein
MRVEIFLSRPKSNSNGYVQKLAPQDQCYKVTDVMKAVGCSYLCRHKVERLDGTQTRQGVELAIVSFSSAVLCWLAGGLTWQCIHTPERRLARPRLCVIVSYQKTLS